MRLAILLCLALAWGIAQSPGRNMTLDVVVTDKSGKPVQNLQESDFTLLDNKKPQKIEGFRALSARDKDNPVEVLILIDAVNTAFTRVAFARDQIDKFLRRDNGELAVPVSLGYFTDSGLKISAEPSRDGNTVAAGLNQQLGLRMFNRREGVLAADELLRMSYDAVEKLIQYERQRPGRKLVVWISPGWPLLSGPGVELQMTEKQRQQILGTVIRFSDGLRAAHVTINDVDPLGMSDAGEFHTFAYQEYVKGVKKVNDVVYGNLALQVLAVQSGGRVFNSGNDITGEIAQCVEDASGYQISFALPTEGPAEYHALEVRLDKKGHIARTRTGYYAH